MSHTPPPASDYTCVVSVARNNKMDDSQIKALSS